MRDTWFNCVKNLKRLPGLVINLPTIIVCSICNRACLEIHHGDCQSMIYWNRDSYKEYNDEVRRLSARLMRIIVAGVEGAKAAHFKQYTESANGDEEAGGLFRWNYYPACPEPEKTLGLTEHTDFNLLTVVHQGLIGGLQILHHGRWIAVKPRPHALAVNLGDMMQVPPSPPSQFHLGIQLLLLQEQ